MSYKPQQREIWSFYLTYMYTFFEIMSKKAIQPLMTNILIILISGVNRMEDTNLTSKFLGATLSVTCDARRARGGQISACKYKTKTKNKKKNGKKNKKTLNKFQKLTQLSCAKFSQTY